MGNKQFEIKEEWYIGSMKEIDSKSKSKVMFKPKKNELNVWVWSKQLSIDEVECRYIVLKGCTWSPRRSIVDLKKMFVIDEWRMIDW